MCNLNDEEPASVIEPEGRDSPLSVAVKKDFLGGWIVDEHSERLLWNDQCEPAFDGGNSKALQVRCTGAGVPGE